MGTIVKAGDTRIRPRNADAGEFGTLGCVLRRHGGDGADKRRYLLSAGHVHRRSGHPDPGEDVCDQGGEAIGRRILWLDPSQPGEPDVLIAELTVAADPSVGSIGMPAGFDADWDPRRDDEVFLYGAATRHRIAGHVAEVDRTISFDIPDAFGNAVTVTYPNSVLAAANELDDGDSGAVVFDHLRRIVGMFVATDEQGRAVITPLGRILAAVQERLGFRLIPVVARPEEIFHDHPPDHLVPPEYGEVEIAWGAVLRQKHGSAFKREVVRLAHDLGIDPSHLTAVMAFETGDTFDPAKRNPVSGATGLIQFMPATARELGTTTEALATMTALEQLVFVRKYLARFSGRMRSLSDVYAAVLWPAAVAKADATVLFRSPSVAYQQNAGLDVNKDGTITKGEAAAKVERRLELGLKDGRRG